MADTAAELRQECRLSRPFLSASLVLPPQRWQTFETTCELSHVLVWDYTKISNQHHVCTNQEYYFHYVTSTSSSSCPCDFGYFWYVLHFGHYPNPFNHTGESSAKLFARYLEETVQCELFSATEHLLISHIDIRHRLGGSHWAAPGLPRHVRDVRDLENVEILTLGFPRRNILSYIFRG